ncbi:uncharacterized protein LOC117101260 isoform X2 [Anneissia japonica]|nr:uncharacterized protein LOC117101260 isoform X2 [Anneissia japonica]
MILPQYIKIDLQHSKHDLSQLICLTEEDEIILNIKRRGWMKYLLGVGLSKGEVGSCMESIPVDYDGIQFFVALDLRDETIEDFLKFESCVTDLVISTHQHQLDSYQGNTDFIINAQPNFIELLEEINTAIEIQVTESSHPLRNKRKGKRKKPKTKDRKDSYADIDISVVKTSSTYQDLTLTRRSSDEYDYIDSVSDSDDGYEIIDEKFQLNNDSRHVYDQPYHNCNDGYLIPNAYFQDSQTTKLPIDGQEETKTECDKKDLVSMELEKIINQQRTVEDYKGYLVPMKRENVKTEDYNNSCLLSMEQGENETGKKLMTKFGYETRIKKMEKALPSQGDKDCLIPTKHKENIKKQTYMTSEENKHDIIPMKQEVDAENKKQKTAEVPMNEKLEKKILKKTEKKHSSESIQHKSQQDYDKNKPNPFVHPLSQGQDTGLERVQDLKKLYKQTANDVMKVLPQSYKEQQSFNSENDIILKSTKLKTILPTKTNTISHKQPQSHNITSQSRILKPIMPLPRKTDTVSRKLVVSGSLESIQSEISTHSSKSIEGNISTNSEHNGVKKCNVLTHCEEIVGNKHKSDAKTPARPKVAPKPCKTKPARPKVAPKPCKTKHFLGYELTSHKTEDIKSSKITVKPSVPPKPCKK